MAAISAERLEALARQGLSGNAAMLRRVPELRRRAVLLATVRDLQITAVDDALDLFAVLMATRLLGPAERDAVKDRLHPLPQLRQASATLAVAARVLLQHIDQTGSGTVDVAAAWTQLQAAVPRDRLAVAVAVVDELAPDGSDEDPAAGQRAELVKRFATTRPFLSMLSEVLPLAATTAGAPVLDAVRALPTLAGAGYDLLRMLGRDGDPSSLGAAFAEYGRAAKTLHLLAMRDPDDETYHRTVHTQLTVQESRHRLARKIVHGQRGELRQRYREGQEDQLGALGLVLNAVVLWNTRYTDAAVAAQRAQGYPVIEADAARLSPLGDAHLNVHGRYSFAPPGDGLRALREAREGTGE